MTQHIVIIIPTYHEREVIGSTIKALIATLSRLDPAQFSWQIFIYDSHSLDGTVDVVRALQKEYPNEIYLALEKQKSGLGSAYIKAMQIAMDTLKADIVFEFDADGSHQPMYLPKMLTLFDRGADVVVGSRYIAGGCMPADWAWYRRFLSAMGNRVARVCLTRQYRDFTSGFRGTRVVFLRKVALSSLLSKNYAYKLHLLWALHQLGAVIHEFPIAFLDRKKGCSKFPRNNVLESLYVVIRLRLRVWKQGFVSKYHSQHD